ncbi:outer membrane family protein [Helicobacter cetorum]|uniref:Hof family outer membrane protein n=1 Tax=Helicobacter cetorum (strain ATCC BAA-429 / MIT 00-7128) TaxID=182217 RepID=I0EMM3_HELC0|nr:outer membrane family protein [Helicobacter cetorum]AFI04192.1 hof family outer membrane protein [Helicobacter cetorum MIT 00-7128]
MKKLKHFSFPLSFLCLVSSAQAFNMNLTGKISTYTKYGFNNQKYQPSKDIYPTGSYTSLLGEFNLSMNLLKGLRAEVGGMVATLPYDSTAKQGNNIPNGQPGSRTDPYASGMFWEYIGWYAGHSGLHVQKPRYWMFHNAYLSYNYKKDRFSFGVKGGRYEAEDYDWFTSFSQGVEGFVKYKDTKFRVMYSDARASASSDWFWYFGRYYTSGKALMIADLKYEKKGLKFNPYFYAIFERMFAPGFNLTYDTNPNFNDKGFRFVGTFVGLFPFFPITGRGNDIILFQQEPMGKNGQTYFLRTRFFYNKWQFGGSIYKNVGNANGDIGIYGDPLGYNIWTNSIYDAEINNIVGANATNGFLYVGSHYKSFTWKVLGRITNSPRADERSLALFLSYFSNRFKVRLDLKLEYYGNITKAGYCIGYCNMYVPADPNGPGTQPLKHNVYSDRSHIMFTATYGFRIY